jgi:anti-sigma factor RsiW
VGCQEIEERLSDYLESSLDEGERRAVTSHLAECAACSSLVEALVEVVSALRSIPVLEPSQGLAERAADAALSAVRAPFRRGSMARITPPGWLLATAAAVTLALTALVLGLSEGRGPTSHVLHVAERTDHAAAYLAERTDRLVENVRILRAVIGTAFEGRVDRVQDRVDDYRRLLERRRAADGVRKSQGFLQNKQASGLVVADGPADSGRNSAPDMAL